MENIGIWRERRRLESRPCSADLVGSSGLRESNERVIVTDSGVLFVTKTEFEASSNIDRIGNADATPSGSVSRSCGATSSGSSTSNVEADTNERLIGQSTGIEGERTADTTALVNDRVEGVFGVFVTERARPFDSRLTAIGVISVAIPVTSSFGTIIKASSNKVFASRAVPAKSRCDTCGSQYSSGSKEFVFHKSLSLLMVYAQEGRCVSNISFFGPFLQLFFPESQKSVTEISSESQENANLAKFRQIVQLFLHRPDSKV